MGLNPGLRGSAEHFGGSIQAICGRGGYCLPQPKAPASKKCGCTPTIFAGRRDSELNAAVAALQCGLTDWTVADNTPLNEIVSLLQQLAASQSASHVPHEWEGNAVLCPEFIFRLERMPHAIFGRYETKRDSAGLRFVTVFNLPLRDLWIYHWNHTWRPP